MKTFVSLLKGAVPQIHWVQGPEAPTCLGLVAMVAFLDELPEPELTSGLVSWWCWRVSRPGSVLASLMSS